MENQIIELQKCLDETIHVLNGINIPFFPNDFLENLRNLQSALTMPNENEDYALKANDIMVYYLNIRNNLNDFIGNPALKQIPQYNQIHRIASFITYSKEAINDRRKFLKLSSDLDDILSKGDLIGENIALKN